ncbi:chondroitin sulfate glucuronyltransferase [Episyrphus balteatus]|uniref:chondroitin sulfate glucuronyltransferase n=1 Tax=Episyrphus balteatus TaxID=286459 RepID=UPI0024850241|nr:chondroitin sulfate glucuronyltransferase [Episyrphus balteatus]
MKRSALNRNHYFVFGFLLGLILSFYIPEDIWELVQNECPQTAEIHSFEKKFGQDFEPHLNLINKPLAAKKPVKNVIRPRYYSSELGIREKIFIGVMTSQDGINTLATAINRTVAHLVNRIKFFINADNVKSNYKLKNIVGFTDTRENLRPFHVIKYLADNYLDDYDYFLIIPDTVYVDARKLQKMLYHLSITFDIYMGKRTDSGTNENGNLGAGGENGETADGGNLSDENDLKMQSDRNYCDLNAGILLSSSVIRKMRNNLDWCVRNGMTGVHSVNIGRCVKYSSRLSGCQENYQGITQKSYSVRPSIKLYKDLSLLSSEEAFRNASVIYPITSADDFYRLHAYFSKYHLENLQHRSFDLEHKAYHIANGTISNNILEIRWPLGVPTSSSPETRHDILVWHFINSTHIFLPNSENVVEPLSRIDSLDFQTVLDISVQYARHKYPGLAYSSIHTVYRRFDPTRGMDYHMHLNFLDAKRYEPRLVTKSFQVVKPLGRVEVVPSPYVTESTRIAIIVPAFEHLANDGVEFVRQYEKICMKNQDNTFLLMIFLYRYDSPSKGDNDPFRNIKNLALNLSTKYKTDGSRIAWLSIRLPAILSDVIMPEDIMLNSIYARNEILSLAVADLALPKIGLESLILMGSTSSVFKADFLNRVRMNTIQGFQVYSPIGFMMYPCKFAHFCKECETCDVSQSAGYFDRWNYDVIAFYSRDYVQARKKLEDTVPIVHNDNDIELLLNRADKTINTILDIFVGAQLPIHILRGVEPNLRYGTAIKNFLETTSDIPKCPAYSSLDNNNNNKSNTNQNNNVNNYSNEIPLRSDNLSSSNSLSSKKCIHLASRKQIGDSIIRFEDKSINNNPRRH